MLLRQGTFEVPGAGSLVLAMQSSENNLGCLDTRKPFMNFKTFDYLSTAAALYPKENRSSHANFPRKNFF